MTRAAWIIALSLGAAPITAASALPDADATPAQFIGWLYARYTVPSGFETMQPDYPQMWSLESHYTPEIVALYERLTALAGPDEVPEFGDGDEICQCQDWENFRLLQRRIRATGEGRAEARVRFRNAGEEKRARLMLERTPAGWRVADLFTEFHPSGLLAALRESVARAEAERAAAH